MPISRRSRRTASPCAAAMRSARCSARAPSGERPEGLFAAADALAAGAIQTMQLAGMHVPSDIAVVGYDNNHFAQGQLDPDHQRRPAGTRDGAHRRSGALRGDRRPRRPHAPHDHDDAHALRPRELGRRLTHLHSAASGTVIRPRGRAVRDRDYPPAPGQRERHRRGVTRYVVHDQRVRPDLGAEGSRLHEVEGRTRRCRSDPSPLR